MNSTLGPECPICQSAEGETLFKMACGNLDQSTLYPTVRIRSCGNCGHVFNELTAEDLEGLKTYYNLEYAPANLTIGDAVGDRPGSAGSLSARRYDQLYGVLAPHTDPAQKILDVGCATGGFLDYLQLKGFSDLSGVEMAQTYVEEARGKNRHKIETGSAESLPFADQTFDVVVMEQVLEHVFNPVMAFRESRRVLRKDGLLVIGVPDAARYADSYFFDFYWVLLREHIQHFDIAHLTLLANRTGFHLVDSSRTIHDVMTERMKMPNLYALFRRSNTRTSGVDPLFDRFNLKRRMMDYLSTEQVRRSRKRRIFRELSKSQQPVLAWGIGREFLYLYESAGLRQCNILGLIDSNEFKQKTGIVDGMSITDGGEWMRKAEGRCALLITAIAHQELIRKLAGSLGYQGRFIDLDAHGEVRL